MKFLQNLSVGTKIITAILVVLGLMVITGWNAITGNNRMVTTVTHLVNGLAAEQKLSEDLNAQILSAMVFANRYINSSNPADLDAYDQEMEKFETLLVQAGEKITQPQRAALIVQIQKDLEAYQDSFKSIRQLMGMHKASIEQVLDVQGPSIQDMIHIVPTIKPSSSSPVVKEEPAQPAAPGKGKETGLTPREKALADQLALAEATARAEVAIGLMRLDVFKFFQEGKPQQLKDFEAHYTEAFEATERLKDLKLNDNQFKMVGDAQTYMKVYKMTFGSIQESLTRRKQIQDEQMNALGNEIRANAAAISAGVSVDFNQEAQDTAFQMESFLQMQVGILAIAIVIGLVSGFAIQRNITSPLKRVTKIARQIAEVDLQNLVTEMNGLASGDLTRRLEISSHVLEIHSKDEVGQMAAAFDTMVRRLQEAGQAFGEMSAYLETVISQVAESSNSLSVSSEHLALASDQTTQATGMITETIQQVTRGAANQAEISQRAARIIEGMSRAIDGVARGAQEQAGAVSSVSKVSTDMGRAIQQVAGNAEAVILETRQAIQAAQQGAKTVETTIHEMEAIRSKVGISAQKVEEMGHHSDQIGRIVETIEDIASQTNLLALNAAIEAARAGEHGKGFAVVADEVRKLAEKSSSSTREIGALIKGIQKSIREASQAMKEGASEVENGVSMAGSSGRALETILKTVASVSQQAEQANQAASRMNASSGELTRTVDAVSAVIEKNTAATQEMAAFSGQVTRSMDQIARVSEENGAAVEEVSASMEEMNAQIEEVSASAQTLAQTAQQLQQLVNQFRLAGQISEAINEDEAREENPSAFSPAELPVLVSE